MIRIKRLSECVLSEVLHVWNEGFKDYFVNVKMTMDLFTYRLGIEELSPEYSVMAFMDDQPVGIVLNGIRTIHGRKMSWNGGTCVLPEYRRHGVGKALIKASLDIYRAEGVDTATLEAFKQNERAIELYRQMGYGISDQLLTFQHSGELKSDPFREEGMNRYQLRRCTPQELRFLSFYNHHAPWQSQWASLRRDGEGLIIESEGKEVGYVLYKRTFDEEGQQTGITVYQCEADPGREDGSSILRFGLSAAFAPFHLACRRVAFNIPSSNRDLTDLLREAGFETAIEQVYMTCSL